LIIARDPEREISPLVNLYYEEPGSTEMLVVNKGMGR
jgi:hypothetical protein